MRSFSPTGNSGPASFFAWDPGYAGGIPVARGDLDGDGTDEIVVGSGPGGSAFFVFSADGTKRFGNIPFGSFQGGLNVSVGDVTGDDRPEIVVAAGPGGGPHVRIYNSNGSVLGDGFFAYGPAFKGGVQVAVGNVSGAAKSQIITAPGAGGGPHVRAFNADGTPADSGGFLAYPTSFTGGVFVAAADFDGDGKAEIVTGAGAGGGPHVKVFSSASGQTGFFAYGEAFSGGVRVATADLDGDLTPEIITGAGPGGGPNVRTFTRVGSLLASFFAYDPALRSGVFVAGASAS